MNLWMFYNFCLILFQQNNDVWNRGISFLKCQSNMKRKIGFFIMMLILTSAHGQLQPHYKRVALKTNIFSPVSIGVEFPVMENLTLEYSARRAYTFIRSRNVYRDERINLKFHRTVDWLMDNNKSVYCLLGFHSKYRSMKKNLIFQGAKENAVLNQSRLLIGVGVQGRLADFWIASERVIDNRVNQYTYTDSEGNARTEFWKQTSSFSMGLSINIFSVHWD